MYRYGLTSQTCKVKADVRVLCAQILNLACSHFAFAHWCFSSNDIRMCVYILGILGQIYMVSADCLFWDQLLQHLVRKIQLSRRCAATDSFVQSFAISVHNQSLLIDICTFLDRFQIVLVSLGMLVSSPSTWKSFFVMVYFSNECVSAILTSSSLSLHHKFRNWNC